MENEKIANLLGDVDNESSKFATRKWYVINDQNTTDYGMKPTDYETKVIKSNLCDYSDAYILATGNITATGGVANTRVAFENIARFKKRITHINDEHIDNVDNLDIVMPMYNLIEYSHNYSDTSRSLWQFKRDEQNMNNGNPANVTTDDSRSPKHKSSLIGESTAVDGNKVFEDVKIAVPLKYLSSLWRSLEIPWISRKINLELNWTKDCVMSLTADTTFKITNTNL